MSVALRAYTYADLAAMPDDGNRYEIIGGELIVAPAPTTNHQRVVNRLSTLLTFHVWERDLGEVFTAPLDVVLSPYNTIQPDILFIAGDRSHITDGRTIAGAPDLVIEVLSGRTRGVDLVRKKAMYATAGVREHWIADPVSRTLTLFALVNGEYEPMAQADGTARSVTVSGFEIAAADVFAGLWAED